MRIATLLFMFQDVVGEATIVTAPRDELQSAQPPAMHVVVTHEQLMETEERSLPRALARLANVWVQETNLGGGSPAINGLMGNRVLLVVDGLRLNDATTRNAHQTLNSIDPAFVERIDIIRGPSSVLYGSDAMGGAILIWTRARAPANSPGGDGTALQADLDLAYESVTEGGRGSLGLSWAGEDDGVLGILGLQEWKDLRAGDDEVQEFTGYNGNSAFGSWAHALDSQRSLRVHGWIDREFDVPRTDRLVAGYGQTQPSNSVWNYKLQDRQSWQLTFDDREAGILAERVQARVAFRRYDEEREIQGLGSNTFRFENDVVETVLFGMDWQKSVGDSQLWTWGIDASNDWVDSERTDTNVVTGVSTPNSGAYAEDSRYTSLGVFAQDEILGVGAWTLVAGARASYFDFSFENFPANGRGREEGSFGTVTGSFSASRPLGEITRFQATLSQGYRAPNLEDLANNGAFFGGEELANPDLDPERNTTAQLALDWAQPRWSASFGAYYTWIEDLIGRQLQDEGPSPTPGDEVYLRSNVGRAEIYGLDANAEHALGGEGTPWSVRGAISWTRGRQYDDTFNAVTGDAPYDDVPFRRIPPLHGNVALRWDDDERAAGVRWAELVLVWATEQDQLNPDDEADPRIDPNGTDGWAILDIDFGGPLGEPAPAGSRASARWNAGVHNLLDENYRVHGSGIDSPGLGVVVGLQLAF